MTNKEVIQLFAKYKPELIAETMDDCYCVGWNHGAYSAELDVDIQDQHSFDEEWLNKEYDTDIWRKSDIEETINSKTSYSNVDSDECHLLHYICKRYGYGDVMEMVSALWRYDCKKDNFPIDGCFVPTCPDFIKKNYQNPKQHELYDRIVEATLNEDRNTVNT